jgi:hypothetical protein
MTVTKIHRDNHGVFGPGNTEALMIKIIANLNEIEKPALLRLSEQMFEFADD